jgi:malic enzyme
VVLAGLLASNALTGKSKLSEHRFLFLGAGEAGTGIADLIAATIVQQSGMTLEEGKRVSYFVDSKGMVSSERKNLEHHKIPYAHDLNALLGYSGKGTLLVRLHVICFYFSSVFSCFSSYKLIRSY